MALAKLSLGLVFAACAAAAASASAANVVTWTDWTSIGGTSASGSMGGTSVSLTAATALDGVSQVDCLFGNTNYWTEPNPALAAYTGGTVGNAPTHCEQVGLNSANRITVTFGSSVSTLYMALLSIGQSGLAVTYDFDQAFTVDSNGVGYWSNTNGGLPGIATPGGGDTLSMREVHGLIRFDAPVTSLTFTTAPNEYWHAFTFGTVPEPGTLALVGAAVLGAGAMRRRRRAQ